jgi:hypothetical protein
VAAEGGSHLCYLAVLVVACGGKAAQVADWTWATSGTSITIEVHLTGEMKRDDGH